MKIIDILGYALSSPYGTGDSLGQPLGVKSIGLIEVHTDTGLVGLGETYAGVYAPELIKPCVDFLKSFLLGLDPFDVELAREIIFHIPCLGRNGLLSSIFSGIEIAIWDILGKATEQPIYKLLNKGSTRDKVKLYASGGSAAFDCHRVEEELNNILDQGFDSFKMRVGHQDWDRDLKRVHTAREILGADRQLMIDAIMGTLKPTWDLNMAKQRANDLAEFQPSWLEEPLHPSNLQDYIRLKEASPVPIATGEALSGTFEFTEYLISNAIDIVQPDVTHCGGYGIAIDVLKLAKKNDIKLVMHVWGSAVAFAANAHFALAFPEVQYLEVPMVPLGLSAQMYTALSQFREGHLWAMEEPGLGVHISPGLKDKYKIVPGSGYRLQ